MKDSPIDKSIPKSKKKLSGNPKSPVSSLLGFGLQLLLLGVGSTFAWLGGIAIAYFHPDPNPTIPLSELIKTQINQWVSNYQQLKQSQLKPTPLPMKPRSTLSPTQKKELQANLKKIQTDLNNLIGRTSQLETQVGNHHSTESLETRIQVLSQQLSMGEETSAIATELPIPQVNSSKTKSPGTSSPNSQPILATDKVLTSDSLMVTLPSDFLFPASTNKLRPETHVILDNLVDDLRNYPKATVRIAGHTDDAGNPDLNRSLSIQRAQAIQAYLEKTLDHQYRWVVIGYGDSRPLVENNSDANRQRNRRIEVAIEPQ